MSDSNRPGPQFGFKNRISEKWLVFVGDCHLINEFLEKKSHKSVFIFFQYFNSLLRSFGNVICANNPISGLIIMIAIASANYKAMLTAVFTSSLSFFFGRLLRQDMLGNLNGFFSYNAVLLGVVSVGYLPSAYDSASLYEPKFWLFLILATLLSVYFTSALASLLKYLSHYPIPCFTLPFNLLQYILMFCIFNNSIPPKIISSHLLEPAFKTDLSRFNEMENETLMHNISYSVFNDSDNLSQKRKINDIKSLEKNFTNEKKWLSTDFEAKNDSFDKEKTFTEKTHLDWGETFAGTIISMSQVYSLNHIPCSVLMFLALIIYSPTTALFSYLGAFLGTLIGIFFNSDVKFVYNGLWGYNGLMCGGALAGFGFVLTPQSTFLAFVAILFSTVFQHFITPLFKWFNVPIFHIPFLASTFLFLLVSTDSETALPRPSILTYPERHRREFREEEKEHLEGYLVRARVSDS